ncbi:DNA-binding XRE family transcriptional regulator [Vogesella perlucida]|nr:DNA-binding XRE family transcriptional regulator [Vogesella perlucida]
MSDMQESKDLSVCFYLQQERERLKLNQAVVAAAAEVAVKTVGRWEREISIPADKLAKLVALGFDAQFVVTGVRSAQALSNEEALLLQGFRDMDEATRKRMLAFVLTGETSAKGPKYTVDYGNAQIGQASAGNIVNKGGKK